jgi:hypothetical protein
LSFGALCQNVNWTAGHIEILNKYGLEQNDHRGIILYFQEDVLCDQKVMTVDEAIEQFLSTQSKKDIYTFCISADPEMNKYNGQPLDLYQIVSLFIEKKD